MPLELPQGLLPPLLPKKADADVAATSVANATVFTNVFI